MEIRGFKKALKSIEENGVKVSTISTDSLPQIVKEMRVSNPEKHHEFNPWHVAKGVSKNCPLKLRRKNVEAWESGYHPLLTIYGGVPKPARVMLRC